jgi:hypothetical protein
VAAPDGHGGHGRLGAARPVAGGVGVLAHEAAHPAEQPPAVSTISSDAVAAARAAGFTAAAIIAARRTSGAPRS